MADSTSKLLGSVAWGQNIKSPQLNPEYGGEFGWAADPAEWMGSAAYIPRNLIPLVLETPEFFKYMPDAQKWVAAGKLFFEKHARSIEGLKAGLTVDTSEHAFGGDGRMYEEFTDVKRDRSTLSATLVDKYGQVWQNYFDKVIRYGMMDPETKVPMISTLAGVTPEDITPNWYSWTVAFIQPDPTGKRCHRCWVCVNVWPKGTGPIEGKMDKTTSLTQSDLSLEFTCLDFVNEGTRNLGQQLLDGINMSYANPQLQEAFITAASADVKAVVKGYQESVERITNNHINTV